MSHYVQVFKREVQTSQTHCNHEAFVDERGRVRAEHEADGGHVMPAAGVHIAVSWTGQPKLKDYDYYDPIAQQKKAKSDRWKHQSFADTM